jgi:phospholipid/cholesterol/gamma-HCH transport system permease protein
MSPIANAASATEFVGFEADGKGAFKRLATVAGSCLAYVGGFAILSWSVAIAPLRRGFAQSHPVRETAAQFENLLMAGMPLLAVLHAGFGSILAMQAFFRATFAETNGAVVGVGMLRSVAPLLTGLAIAALMAVRMAFELRSPLTTAENNEEDDESSMRRTGELVLPRVLAAVLAAPVLALWGAAVGTLVGCLISKRVLGVASGTYFGFFFEMLRTPDVVGVLVLSTAYAGAAALMSCYEATRHSHRSGVLGIDLVSIYRSFVLSTVLILAINSVWFTTVYVHGGIHASPVGAPGLD